MDDEGIPHLEDIVEGKRALKQYLLEHPDIEYEIVEFKEVETVNNALYNVDSILDSMLDKFHVSGYTVFLSGSNNFRNEVYPIYKANRLNVPRPVHYLAVREHLMNKWDAVVVQGMEADDALGIHQTDTSVICTIDKDLDTITGKHYNFVTDTLYDVSPLEAANNFYMQMLAGDSTDNICGIRGVGMITAKKRLDKYENYCDGAIEEYKKYYGEDWEEAWQVNELLLGILCDEDNAKRVKEEVRLLS